MKESFTVINCQSLDDISPIVQSLELTDSKTIPLTVRIKLMDGTKIKLGHPKGIQQKDLYSVKIVDAKGHEWAKILEEK